MTKKQLVKQNERLQRHLDRAYEIIRHQNMDLWAMRLKLEDQMLEKNRDEKTKSKECLEIFLEEVADNWN